MKKVISQLWISMILLSACSAAKIQPPTATPTSPPTNTPEPTITPTSIPPTPASRFIELKSGGFSLAIQPDLDFDTDDYSVNISDKQGKLVISLNGKPYIESSYTLESFLGKYVVEIGSRGGSFIQSAPYEIIIDGMSGLAVDLTGNFLNDPVAGKAIIISPGKNFVIFGLGISNLATDENDWIESGSVIFDVLIESIEFNAEVKD